MYIQRIIKQRSVYNIVEWKLFQKNWTYKYDNVFQNYKYYTCVNYVYICMYELHSTKYKHTHKYKYIEND